MMKAFKTFCKMLFQVLWQKSHHACRQRYKEIDFPLILVVPLYTCGKHYAFQHTKGLFGKHGYTHSWEGLSLEKNLPFSWEPAQQPPQFILLGC